MALQDIEYSEIGASDLRPSIRLDRQEPRVSQMTLTTLDQTVPFSSDICSNLALTPLHNRTDVGVVLSAEIKAETFAITMEINQLITVHNAVIDDNHKIGQTLRADLLNDVIDVLKRMVYEVTEIAFNKQGYALSVHIDD